jgi:hypothetical protein
MDTATGPRRHAGHFARAPTREAIQPKDAYGGTPLSCNFSARWLAWRTDRAPARPARTGRAGIRRSVVEHTLYGQRFLRVSVWCHVRCPYREKAEWCYDSHDTVQPPGLVRRDTCGRCPSRVCCASAYQPTSVLTRCTLRVRHFWDASEAKPAQCSAGLGNESLSFGARPPAEQR